MADLFNLQRKVKLTTDTIGTFADSACASVNEVAGRVVSIALISDRRMKELNDLFRGKDSTTDVLSFPSTDKRQLGEIAISADRAAAQARSFGHSISNEIRILMLHGLLHLLGMDHETDRGEMARAEARWRRKLDLPNTLIARAS